MYTNIIAVPYRNRETHLEYFIQNTVPLIQEYLPNSRVVVIEQTNEKLFNRGKLLNVAFKEYESKTKYFFTHDIDINPTKKCIEEFYSKDVTNTEVLGIYTSICDTLGGIIKVQNEIIHLINGFPNDIWGWGAEDKALQNRSEYFNIKKITTMTNNKEYPDYLKRFNDINDRVTKNNSKNINKYDKMFKQKNKDEQYIMIFESGLNNIEYKIIERKMIHDIVEIIKVDI
jgi:hypothetical protein